MNLYQSSIIIIMLLIASIFQASVYDTGPPQNLSIEAKFNSLNNTTTLEIGLTNKSNPVYISGDTNLQNVSDSGIGTVSNPYIIKDYNLTICGYTHYGFSIFSTDKYLTLENINISVCRTGLYVTSTGIFIENAKNIKIIDSNISSVNLGISVADSSNIIIDGNNLIHVPEPISLVNGFNCSVQNNRIENILNTGISISQSSDMTIFNNSLISGIIAIRIDSSASVYLTNNTVEQNEYSYDILSTNASLFRFNSGSTGLYGFYITKSTNNTFSQNSISSESNCGFCIFLSTKNTFTHNLAMNNTVGYHADSNDNLLIENEFGSTETPPPSTPFNNIYLMPIYLIMLIITFTIVVRSYKRYKHNLSTNSTNSRTDHNLITSSSSNIHNTIICKFCFKEVSNNDIFCENCGQKIS